MRKWFSDQFSGDSFKKNAKQFLALIIFIGFIATIPNFYFWYGGIEHDKLAIENCKEYTIGQLKDSSGFTFQDVTVVRPSNNSRKVSGTIMYKDKSGQIKSEKMSCYSASMCCGEP